MILQPMVITYFIMLIVIFLLFQSKYRPDLIVIGALLVLTLVGVLTPEEALSGFSNSTVMLMAGLFIVGAGVVDAGVVFKMGDSLLRWGGKNEKKMLVLIIIMISIFIGFLSIYGMIAVLIPVIMSIAFKLNLNPSRFLLPLVFAGSIGGLLTLIGSPTNLIVSDYLVKAGYDELGFFQITGIGLIILVGTLVFFMTIGKKLMPTQNQATAKTGKRISAGELAGLYKVYDRLHFIIVPQTSDIVGERLSDIKLPSRYEITIIDIERKVTEDDLALHSKQSIVARANEVIFPNDLLFVFGENEHVNQFVKDYELVPCPFDAENVQSHFLSKIYGVTEILILPHSSMENLTISDMHFREKYSCNVLAINRKGEYLQSDLANERLKPGDALLVHGKWEDIEIAGAEKQDFVVLGSNTEESNEYSKGKTPIALGILVFMLLLMAFDIVPKVLSVSIAAFLMIVTGCIRSIEEAYKRIGWEVIILLACIIPIAKALEKTGGTQFLTNGMMELFGSYGPYAMLFVFYVITSLFSQFINNLVSVVIIAPIAIATALGMGFSPYPFVIAVTIAATLSFAVTATASPTNAMVMTAGGYKVSEFVKIGIPLQFFAGLLALITIPLFFPF